MHSVLCDDPVRCMCVCFPPFFPGEPNDLSLHSYQIIRVDGLGVGDLSRQEICIRIAEQLLDILRDVVDGPPLFGFPGERYNRAPVDDIVRFLKRFLRPLALGDIADSAHEIPFTGYLIDE